MDINEFSVASASGVNMPKELNMNNFQIIEEGPQVSQKFDISNFQTLKEGPQAVQELNMSDLRILEEGPRVCPLCSQEVRLYFINYNEKVEMCENLECDYPFGYEPLKIVREENGVQAVEVKSVTYKASRSTVCSQTSSQGWSDVDKLCNGLESYEVPNLELNKPKTTAQLKKMESERRKQELLQNVEKIKQMTKNMNNAKKESKGVIKNEKWIKNLQFLQGLSGVNLLKPAEMKKIKKKCPPGSGELKIDIDRSNLSGITIEVNHARAGDTKQV